MNYEKTINGLMENIEKYISAFLYEQLELCVTLAFEEEKDLVLVRERILTDLPKYVAPLALERVILSVRKVIAFLIKEEEELFEANETDSEEEEEEEDNVFKPVPPSSNKTKKLVPLVSPNEETTI